MAVENPVVGERDISELRVRARAARAVAQVLRVDAAVARAALVRERQKTIETVTRIAAHINEMQLGQRLTGVAPAIKGPTDDRLPIVVDVVAAVVTRCD